MISFLTFTSLIFPLVAFSAAVEIQFQELRSLVESKNERVQAQTLEKSAAEKREGLWLRSFLPRLEVKGAQESFKKGRGERTNQPTFGAEASLNFFNGGRDYLESSRSSMVSERKGFERQAVLAQELGKARETFWSLVYLREVQGLLKEALALNEANLRSAGRRIKSGVATETDRVEFEMKEIDLKREVANTDLEIQHHRKNLSVLLGFEPGTELKISEVWGHEHKWEDALLHTHDDHDFMAKPKELGALELMAQAKTVGRSYWPKLDAYAAWNQFNQREEDSSVARERTESVVGLRLTMDIFDGLSSQKESSALRLEAEALALEANYHKREIETHIQNELAELKLLHDQVHEAEENTKRAQRYYSLTQSEYGRGVKNSPDVLGATEKLFDMKQKHLAIVRDFQIAKSHVLSKIGK